MVEVDRVDAARSQGVALQVQPARQSPDGREVLRLPRAAGDVHAQITMRSISSTVTVSAVRS